MSKDSLKNNNDEWLKAVRSSLENYQEPFDLSWDKLEKELSACEVPVIPFYRRRSFGVASSVAAVIALMFSVKYVYNDAEVAISEGNVYTELIQQQSEYSDNSEATADDLIAVSTDKPASHDKNVIPVTRRQIEKPVFAEEIITCVESDLVDDVQCQTETQVAEQSKEVNAEKSRYYTDNLPGNETYGYKMPVSGNKKAGHGWELALASSQSPEYTKTGTLDLSAIPANILSGDPENAIVVPGDKVLHFDEGLAYMSDYHYEHSQPVTFGFNVRKYMTERISIETGLSYTMLNAKLTDATKVVEKKQRMNYLSLPVRVNYNLTDNDKLNLYGSLGASMAVCVYGNIDGQTMRDESLRFAGLASLGLEYKFFSGLGVYLEPGVAYNLDADSNVRTIYDENRVNFALNVGLRLSFR